MVYSKNMTKTITRGSTKTSINFQQKDSSAMTKKPVKKTSTAKVTAKTRTSSVAPATKKGMVIKAKPVVNVKSASVPVTGKVVTPIISSLASAKKAQPVSKQQVLMTLIVIGLAALLYIYRGLFVAAIVNGQPIARWQILQAAEKAQGNTILQQLVTEKLIAQKANEAKIEITDQAINEQVDQIKKAVTDQGQDFDQLMSLQGLTMDDLKYQLRLQKMIEQLVASEVQVSDEEVTKYLTDNKDYLPEDKSEDELKTLAKEQLSQEKLSTKYQEWMKKTKEEAKINYFVEYASEE